MIQFLIDEDVTPKLQEVAHERGYNAYHVQYLDRKGRRTPPSSASCWTRTSPW